jgi:hypothetical protein
MVRFAKKQAFGLLSLLAITAIALSACSSSGSTTAPGGNNPATTTAPGGNNPAVTDAPGGGGTGLDGASGAFASITSYKFSMTLAGGSFGSMLSVLGGAGATGAGAITVSGTVTTNPKASDVTMAGIRIVEVGGFDYMDIGMGGFIKSPQSGSSLADGFSPSSMFSSSLGASSGYKNVGSENKNGVDTDHFQGSDSAFSGMSKAVGVANATWTADVWIAKTGGYPVSMAIIAKTSDNTVVYEVMYDMTNINDSSLNVTAPTNIMPGS